MAERANLLGYRAKLETRNFEFKAFGRTESEALKLLDKGLVAHSKEYGRPDMPAATILKHLRSLKGDVSVQPIYLGAYRSDGFKIA